MAYFRDKLRGIFQVRESPHRVALAFAMGIFLGISPFLGFHYAGAILAAWLFRLNKLVAIIGVSVNNPWTIVPISGFCAWLGAKMLGINQMLPQVDWSSIGFMTIIQKLTDINHFISAMEKLMPLIKSFFVGSLITSLISASGGYVIMRILVKRYHKSS